MLTVENAAAVIVPCIAVIVWLVRLEGRVNGHDLEHKNTREDLRYIRSRIDRAIGTHREEEDE